MLLLLLLLLLLLSFPFSPPFALSFLYYCARAAGAAWEEVSAGRAQGGGGRKSVKLKPHAFMLLQSGGKPVLLAAETAEEKGAWLDTLRGFARRSLEAREAQQRRASGWLSTTNWK